MEYGGLILTIDILVEGVIFIFSARLLRFARNDNL